MVILISRMLLLVLRALPLGFEVKLGLVRGKYILHAAEASCVSASSLSAFRAAVVWASWSSKLPLAKTPAVLNLLDGSVGVDPALHFVWVRFRTMRRYIWRIFLTRRLGFFTMLDLISIGAPGHGPVHLLLISAAELGFAWDGGERGWVRPSLPPLGMMTGPTQHFFSSILDAWRFRVFCSVGGEEGFSGCPVCGLQGLCATTYLFPPEGKR